MVRWDYAGRCGIWVRQGGIYEGRVGITWGLVGYGGIRWEKWYLVGEGGFWWDWLRLGGINWDFGGITWD